MMKHRSDFLKGLAERAKNCSPCEVKCVAQHSISENDGEGLATALNQEFPFLFDFRPIEPEQEQTVCGLFQWLVEQLLAPTCRVEIDLEQVLFIGIRLDFQGQLWKELAQVGVLRPSRLEELSKLVAFRSIPIDQLSRYVRVDREQLQRDLDTQNWDELDWTYRHISEGLYDPYLSNAAVALAHFAPESLMDSLKKAQSVLSLIVLIESLSPEYTSLVLQAAVTGENWLLKYWALRLSLSKYRDIEQYAHEANHERLLCQAAENLPEWEKWVKVLFAFPSRYPELQRPIGYALCSMSPIAVSTFITAIRLANANRKTYLSTSFLIVKQCANDTQRKMIWRSAYDHWNAWNFGAAEIHSSLYRVVATSLDSAVVGYFRECVSGEDLQALDQSMQTEIRNVPDVWFAEIGDYLAEINRRLSRYQLIRQASQPSSTDEAWVRAEEHHFPEWLRDSRYWRLRVHLDQ